MTTKTLDWLNANRFRAYPFVNDRGLVCNGMRIPSSVVLDALAVDTGRRSSIPELIFTKIEITSENTSLELNYAGQVYTYSYSGGTESGEGSFIVVRDNHQTANASLHFRLVLSSHAYNLSHAGCGSWSFRGRILPTKVVSVTASGVSGLLVHGSQGDNSVWPDDYGKDGKVKGVVTLKDGYRTMSTIQNGRVIVRVGTKYGEDPCHHYWGDVQETNPSCDDRLLFFNGQTADIRGNVNFQGGPGVSITQGRKYVAKKDILDSYGKVGIRKGEEIPCLEISATSELLRIYTPTGDSSDSSPGGN